MADVMAAAAKRLTPGVRLVISERGERSQPYHQRGRRLLDRALTFAAADRVAPNSRFGADLLRRLGVDERQLVILPNGVILGSTDADARARLRQRLGWPADAFVVGTTCRLVETKGVDVLLRAVAQASVPRLRVAVIGDGPQRASLVTMAAELGISAEVAFLGEQVPARPLVAGLDAFALLTTGAEHCSNAILEAMACSLPVIATWVGGNGELVADGVTGHLVPAGDSLAVAALLAALAASPGRGTALGAAGLARINALFRMDQIAGRHMAVWRDLAGPGLP
jgi:glycosyltransferase involved in cell wall biosynthesis